MNMAVAPALSLLLLPVLAAAAARVVPGKGCGIIRPFHTIKAVPLLGTSNKKIFCSTSQDDLNLLHFLQTGDLNTGKDLESFKTATFPNF